MLLFNHSLTGLVLGSGRGSPIDDDDNDDDDEGDITDFIQHSSVCEFLFPERERCNDILAMDEHDMYLYIPYPEI